MSSVYFEYGRSLNTQKTNEIRNEDICVKPIQKLCQEIKTLRGWLWKVPNMSVFERIDFLILTYLALLFHSKVVCSDFEIISMRSSSNIEILPEEVKAAVSSYHWMECSRKCKELETPSTCNTIQFDQATNNCFLAYKEIIQNICPSISKRSLKGSFKRRKRSGCQPDVIIN